MPDPGEQVNRLLDELGESWVQHLADSPRPLTRPERDRALRVLFDDLTADTDTPPNT